MESDQAAELHVTITPRPGAPAAEQAEEMFSAAAEAVRSAGGRIFQERVFGADEALEAVGPIRGGAYGDLADGLAPALLVSPPAALGSFAGLQVHAVCAQEPLRPLPAAGAARGRALSLGGREYVALAALAAPQAGSPTQQSRAVLEMAETAVREVGGDMTSVVRTWLWLGDILAWYDEFNRVRNVFFRERGLIDDGSGQVRLPASTGIGVRPAGGAACAMDLLAVVGPGTSIAYLEAAGMQRSAYKYGSAFSRALRTMTAGGETVFVSGTAAIDADGKSQHVGDAAKQIEMTLDNVRAVLQQQGCGDEDVVQAMAYCKTPDVQAVWRAGWAELPWPCVTVISDVCRDELLFEVEATACPGAR